MTSAAPATLRGMLLQCWPPKLSEAKVRLHFCACLGRLARYIGGQCARDDGAARTRRGLIGSPGNGHAHTPAALAGSVAASRRLDCGPLWLYSSGMQESCVCRGQIFTSVYSPRELRSHANGLQACPACCAAAPGVCYPAPAAVGRLRRRAALNHKASDVYRCLEEVPV